MLLQSLLCWDACESKEASDGMIVSTMSSGHDIMLTMGLNLMPTMRHDFMFRVGHDLMSTMDHSAAAITILKFGCGGGGAKKTVKCQKNQGKHGKKVSKCSGSNYK